MLKKYKPNIIIKKLKKNCIGTYIPQKNREMVVMIAEIERTVSGENGSSSILKIGEKH
jgi:hypothetical protein